MFTTTIIVLIAQSDQPLSGVKVSLYDRDRYSADDLLGTARTDQQGQARISFSERSFADRPGRLDDAPVLWPRGDRLPDLYITVHGTSGEIVASTRQSIQENTVPNLITVTVDWESALKSGLAHRKPVRTPAERQRGWTNTWKKRTASDPGPGPTVDLCFARVVLDAVARADDPQGDLQKRVSLALADRIPAQHRRQVLELAQRGIKNIDATGLLRGRACSSASDPTDLAKLLMQPGGPLHSLNQAISERVASPWETVGPQAAGYPFTKPFEDLNKTCRERFANRDHSLDETARQQMADYLAHGLNLLVPPMVNEIEVFRPFVGTPGQHPEGFPARRAWTHLGTLAIKELDFQGGTREQTLAMNVALNDERCLYHFSDGEQVGGQPAQALATDVKYGETVTLKGASFIAETATVTARFSAWAPEAVDGKLKPQNANAPETWEALTWWEGAEVSVHGRQFLPGESLANRAPATCFDDKMVFDWPEQAQRPGLYRLQFIFKNREHLPTAAGQNPTSCRLEIERADYVRTQVLWFAVLPEASPLPIQARATAVDCLDLTNPEIWPDDVKFIATGLITGPLVDLNNLQNPDPEIRVPQHAISDEFWFFRDGQTRNPSSQVIQPAGGGFRTLQRDEFLLVSMIGEEVEGPLDVLVVTFLILAVLVAVVTILAAIAVVVVVVLLAWEVVTTPVAAAIISGIIAAWLGAVLGAVLSGAFTGALSAAILDAVGAEPVVIGTSTFGGYELAHWYSPFRILRLLWPRERGQLGSTGLPTTRSTDFRDGEIEEVFTSEGAGGRYAAHVVLDMP